METFDESLFEVGKISKIHFEDENAEDLKKNLVTVHVFQEIHLKQEIIDLFEPLIPLIQYVDLESRKIFVLLPAGFKLNIGSILTYFVSNRISDTNRENPPLPFTETKREKLFEGQLRNAEIAYYLFEAVKKLKGESPITKLIKKIKRDPEY